MAKTEKLRKQNRQLNQTLHKKKHNKNTDVPGKFRKEKTINTDNIERYESMEQVKNNCHILTRYRYTENCGLNMVL